MNAIILIAVLFLIESCHGTLSPPTGKNKREKGRNNDKVSIEKMSYVSSV